MICCLTELIGNVRVHSSAQQHVENLDAAADGQQRHFALERPACQVQFQSIPVRVGHVDHVVFLTTRLGRVDVTAACQDEAVDRVQHGVCASLTGRDQQRQAPRTAYSFNVVGQQ